MNCLWVLFLAVLFANYSTNRNVEKVCDKRPGGTDYALITGISIFATDFGERRVKLNIQIPVEFQDAVLTLPSTKRSQVHKLKWNAFAILACLLWCSTVKSLNHFSSLVFYKKRFGKPNGRCHHSCQGGKMKKILVKKQQICPLQPLSFSLTGNSSVQMCVANQQSERDGKAWQQLDKVCLINHRCMFLKYLGKHFH